MLAWAILLPEGVAPALGAEGGQEVRQAPVTCVLFFGDGGGVLGEKGFGTTAKACQSLRLNGFARWSVSRALWEFVDSPAAPLCLTSHPNGRILLARPFLERMITR